LDFAYHYTQEQECFRQEVGPLLDACLSTAAQQRPPASGPPEHGWEEIASLKKWLGQRGWLLPDFTQDGHRVGLSQSRQLVLWEELEERDLLSLVAESGWSLAQAVAQWGTESQAASLLPALVRGEVSCWRCVIEEGLEPDGETLTIEAVEDSDDFVLDGNGMFSGISPRPDYVWVLARIRRGDAATPITASFLAPANLTGIAFPPARPQVDSPDRPVNFAQVRVPRTCLLGSGGEGWFLMTSSLLAEQSLRHPQRADAALDDLLRYADGTCRNGVKLSEEPVLQQLLMEAYTSGGLLRLLRTRDAWLRDSGGEVTYQEAQTRLWERRSALRLAEIVREVVGLYALLDSRDPRSPAGGRFESQQRGSLALYQGSPGVERESDIIARHLGLGRDRQWSPDATSPGVDADAPVVN
jgi:alkylation response protein AidB-like acyl-CoA dehydrogenase